MKVKENLFLVLVLICLVGCTAGTEQQVTSEDQTLQAETSITGTVPGKTIIPTETLEAVQATTSPEIPSTPLSHSFKVQTFCPSVDLAIGDMSNLPGTLVFSGNNRLVKEKVLIPEFGKDSMLSFWNPQSDNLLYYNFPEGQEYYIYAESPDKAKLALTHAKTIEIPYALIVVSNQAEEYGRIDFPDDWTFYNWLNNEQLLFRQYRTTKDISREQYNLVAINFLDQDQQTLSSEFPNIFLGIYWSWGTPTFYNPNAAIVMYHEYDNDTNQSYSIFFDVEENKLIAKMASDDWARWSSDGSRMLLISDIENDIISTNQEIYLFDAAAREITQVSFFKEQYEELAIELPVWSPDNRFIAFWMKTDSLVETSKLAVLDTETFTVDVFCHEINPHPFRFGLVESLLYQEIQVNSTSPIWSPDSQYILIENNKKGESDTLLVDLQNHEIIKIADQARPVAWLK